jgi:sulfopyruvate decarboxylase TPP-binding subunit
MRPSIAWFHGMSMLNGPSIVAAFRTCGITHVVWVPDSELGNWEPSIMAEKSLQLIRVCREGEAVAVAGGLYLGGCRPIVLMQCTGFFEAGDAFRNFVHDLKLPLFFVIGVRSYYLQQQGATSDTCPVFTEPIVQAWRVPYCVLDKRHTAEDVTRAYRQALAEKRAGIVLLAE